MLSIYDKNTSIKTFINYLFIIFLFFLGLHCISSYYVYCCETVIKKLDLNYESNPPTIYAALLLFFASRLLNKISNLGTTNTKDLKIDWKSLSYIFLFLAIDELFRVHDGLNHGVYGTWLKFYVPFVVLVGLRYLRFLFKIPKEFAIGIFVAGVIFVSGAAGCEVLGIFVKNAGYGIYSLEYRLLATVEECLEFIGVILFISTLLKFIHFETKETVYLKFPFHNYFTRKK